MVVGVGSNVPAAPIPPDSGAPSRFIDRSPSTSAASTRTRAATSCSRISCDTRRRFRTGWTWCSWATPSSTCRDTPEFIIWGFSTIATSSMRSRPSDLLIMPSYFESLSMVALEAWALGRPVLANGRCDVLRGQCHPQQRWALLRTLRGVRRSVVCARVQRSAERAARTERTRLLSSPLRVARHRAEVSADVRPAREEADPSGSNHCQAGMHAAIGTCRPRGVSSHQIPEPRDRDRGRRAERSPSTAGRPAGAARQRA